MVDQPNLFEEGGSSVEPSAPVRLDLPDGEVVVFERCFNRDEADSLFRDLRSGTHWRQETTKLYGRVHPIPRLTAWHGDPGRRYTYSKIEMDPEPWTPPLLLIKSRIEQVSGESFNSVLLNLYRHGKDSVSWHSDDERELGLAPVIGSVSLGASRRFMLRHKQATGTVREIRLTHGSFLVMRPPTQAFWHHQIPKTSERVGERINLTFRWIGDAASASRSPS